MLLNFNDSGTNGGNLIDILIILALMGAGFSIYLTVIKPKLAQNKGGTTCMDEFYDDEDDD